jgi:hypothetical protein
MIYRSRRSGVGLTEALVALFIVAIGLTALLALWPLGISSMARAFKDGRTGQLSNSSDSLVRLVWRDLWIDPNTDSIYTAEEKVTGWTKQGQTVTNPTYIPGNEQALRALDNPNAPWYSPVDPSTLGLVPPLPPEQPFDPVAQGGVPNPQTTAAPRLATDSGASYAVFIDPIGFARKTGADKWWVGGQSLFAVPRRSLATVAFPTSPPQPIAAGGQAYSPLMQNIRRLRMFSLLDDLTFDRNSGAAELLDPGTLTLKGRAGRYNCGWLIQRDTNSRRSRFKLTVVAYENRTPDAPVQEVATTVAAPVVPFSTQPSSGANASSYSILVNWTGPGRPPLKRGGWIMLVSGPQFATQPPPKQPEVPEPVADFYRVIGINDDQPGVLRLELQNPVRPVAGSLLSFNAGVVFMEGVSEVFEENPVDPWMPPIR